MVISLSSVVILMMHVAVSEECILPKCREPDDLDAKLRLINNNINISSLVILDPIVNSECYNDHLIRTINETETHKLGAKCPDSHPQTGPFILRTSCPWFPVADTNLNRYPVTIYKADSHCRHCVGSRDLRCQPLIRMVKVFVRNGTCGDNGEMQYDVVEIKIPIAYTCVKLRVRKG